MSQIKDESMYFVVCGSGELLKENKELARTLGMEKRTIFTGYREDIANFYKMADLFVFPSFREGLPVALMEAMAAELPCIASQIRGNVDLMPDSPFLFRPGDVNTLAELIQRCSNMDMSAEIEKNSRHLRQFSLDTVASQMRKIYCEQLSPT